MSVSWVKGKIGTIFKDVRLFIGSPIHVIIHVFHFRYFKYLTLRLWTWIPIFKIRRLMLRNLSNLPKDFFTCKGLVYDHHLSLNSLKHAVFAEVALIPGDCVAYLWQVPIFLPLNCKSFYGKINIFVLFYIQKKLHLWDWVLLISI